METLHASRLQSTRFLGAAALTVIALLMAFAAFDDITTGNEPDFSGEYLAAAICGVCLLLVSIQLLRHRRYVLGVASLTALAGAIWAEPAIKPGMVAALSPEYAVFTGAFIWFAAIALYLGVTGWADVVKRRDRIA